MWRHPQVKHNIKMPYKMLQGVRRKAKERALREAAVERQSGVVTGKRSTLSQLKSAQKEKKGAARKRQRA
jgi:hypothetical protein